MRVAVTFIHHDRFALRLGGRTLLFDWPAAAHRTPQAAAAAACPVPGVDVFAYSRPGDTRELIL